MGAPVAAPFWCRALLQKRGGHRGPPIQTMLMKINGCAALSLLLLIVTVIAPGCNRSQSNSNRTAPQASVKPARWLSQFRSPSSLSYAGTNLAVFFYSGISVVSPNVVFVCGDMPLAGEQR